MKNNNVGKKNNAKRNIIIVIIASVLVVLIIVGIIIYKVGRDERIDPEVDEKPIIYLYPEKETELSIELGKPENITCSYPEYQKGWNVIANPDGTLIDMNTGRKLYSLYWEGIQTEPIRRVYYLLVTKITK